MSSFRVKKKIVKKQVPEVRIGSERWQGLERKNALQHISMISADHLHIHYRSGWPEPYIYTPYVTIYLVISLPKLPYIHRIYIWFWPTLAMCDLCACVICVQAALPCVISVQAALQLLIQVLIFH